MAHIKSYLFIFSLFLVENSFCLFADDIPGVQGDGTVGKPYRINGALGSTPLWKLNKIAKWVNKDTSAPDGWDGAWSSTGKRFKLEADIATFTNTIGTENSPFMGAFDGNGYRIDVNIQHYANNWNWDGAGRSKGLFGKAVNANIKNVTVTAYVVGSYYVGGVLRQGEHTEVLHCTNLATVSCTQYDRQPVPWPLPLSGNGSYDGNNSSSGSTQAIVGGDDILLPPPYDPPFPPIHLRLGGQYAGGIVGYGVGNGVLIEDCANSGYISGYNSIGGILGYGSNETVIHRSLNIGTVKGVINVGGIAGSNVADIDDPFNGGFIHAASGYAGGIIGNCGNFSVDIEYCINTGVVKGYNNVGGIAGYMSFTTSSVNNYYDKQMCPYGGINGMDIANKAVGKVTRYLIGNKISWASSGTWDTIGIDFYPLPAEAGNKNHLSGFYRNDCLYHVASSTLRLQSSPLLETVDSVIIRNFSTFHLYNSWRAKNNSVTRWQFKAPYEWVWDATGYGDRLDTMESYCSAYSKLVPIYIPYDIWYKTATETDFATNAFSIGEVTPNIVTDNAAIAIQTATEGNLNISIYDLAGTKVENVADRFVNANTSLQVDLNNVSNLSTGSYMAVVSVGNEVVMRKFVKQ